MASNTLRSSQAAVVSVLIVRAFVHMRTALMASSAQDAAILKLLAEIRRLTQFPESSRRGIGFTARWPKEE